MISSRLCSLLLLAGSSFCGCFQVHSQSPAELNASQRREVIEAAWLDVSQFLYDPSFRGVNWAQTRTEYLDKADAVTDLQELEALVRQMLGLLHNSHIGVMTHEEYSRTQYVLPLFFDRVDGRVFVSYVFKARNGNSFSVRFGDEIISVDGHLASNLLQPTVTWLQPVLENPYYGPAGSWASLQIRRRGKLLTLRVARIHAFSDVVSLETRHYGQIGYLRFLKMNADAVPPEMLLDALKQVSDSEAIVLDLRHCVGGDGTVADPLGGMLLGPHVELVTRVPRPDAMHAKREVEETTDVATAFKGKAVVITDAITQSEPEMLTAALKEYGRATVIGETTHGALNGLTAGMPLPDRVGILAIPINRSISPKGREYEGIGVAPNRHIANKRSDYQDGKDEVLSKALRIAASKR